MTSRQLVMTSRDVVLSLYTIICDKLSNRKLLSVVNIDG